MVIRQQNDVLSSPVLLAQIDHVDKWAEVHEHK